MKVLKTIAVQLFTGANIATILLLWLCCIVTYIHPSTAPKLSLVTLAFPAFLLVNIAFILFWLIFKVKRIWLPILGIAVCWSFVRDYVPFNFGVKQSQEALKILTFNTKGFGGIDAKDSLGHFHIMNYLQETGADIICLQEIYAAETAIVAFEQEMQQRGYSCFRGQQEMIFSRLPMLSTDTLSLSMTSQFGLMAWLEYAQDSILLINCHLESDHLSPEMKKAYWQSIRSMEQDSLRRGVAPVVRLLVEAAPVRAAQTDTIAAIVRQNSTHPVIVCGDFNDTPVSYTHRILTQRLSSAYRQSGNGLGFTFHEHGFPVRIDHIFFSPAFWSSSETKVVTDMPWSDHYPLVTSLNMATK